VGFRQFERFLAAATGAVLAIVGLVVLGLELLPGPARVVLGAPLIGVGVLVLWASIARWTPEVGSAGRRDSPELLLAVERVFLVPLVALEVAGLLAVLRDPDFNPVARLVVGLSTALVLVVTAGLVVGRIRLPSRYLGRREPLPPEG
jgi:hypothetical protein